MLNKPDLRHFITHLPPTCTAASEHSHYPFTPHVHSSRPTRSLPITPLPCPLPQGRKDDTHKKSIKNHAPSADALLSGQHSLLFVGVVSFSMTFRWEITISRARLQFRQLFEQFLTPLPITPARRGRTTEPFITYLPPAVPRAWETVHYPYTDFVVKAPLYLILAVCDLATYLHTC